MQSTEIVIYLVCLAALGGFALGIAIMVAIYQAIMKGAFR